MSFKYTCIYIDCSIHACKDMFILKDLYMHLKVMIFKFNMSLLGLSSALYAGSRGSYTHSNLVGDKKLDVLTPRDILS